jgi:hypothetical protein
MHEDDLFILGFYSIFWITLALFIVTSTNKLKKLTIHLCIQVAYSVFFWFQLYYNSKHGSGLATWFFWLLFIGIHWLVCLIQLGIVTWNKIKLG